jgi:hypothetical protein
MWIFFRFDFGKIVCKQIEEVANQRNMFVPKCERESRFVVWQSLFLADGVRHISELAHQS